MLDGSSWSRLGIITGKDNRYLIVDAVKQSKLPDNVERVHISHHRFLLSLASLEFTIIVDEPFQKRLREITERYYLPVSISASLWPSKLFKWHSTSLASGAESSVAQYLKKFVKDVVYWLMSDLHLNKKYIHLSAIHPLYQLEFPSDVGGINEYSKTHTTWLSKYGYRDAEFHRYSSDAVIFCPARRQGESDGIGPLFFEEQQQDYFWLLIDGLLKGMVCYSALLCRLTTYKMSIESLRSTRLKDLNTGWKIIQKSEKTIYDLKHLIL